MGTNITGTKQALLELTTRIETLKADILKARRGDHAVTVLTLQQQMAEALDLVTACMSEIHEAIETSIGVNGNC